MQKSLYFSHFLSMQTFIFMLLSGTSSAFGAHIKQAGFIRTDTVEYQIRVEREAEAIKMPVIDNILKNQCPEDFQFMVSVMVEDHKSALGLPPILLLYGKPGVGKSTVARGLAAKAKMACVFIKCPELGTTYQNSASFNLGGFMREAIENKHPYIIVLDEIGSILEYAKNNPKLNEDAAKAFLTLTDELREKNPHARIIGTTNTFDTFPQAAQDRFARKFEIYSPRDADGYKDMIRSFVEPMNVECDDELLSLMAERAMGYSTRKVEAIVHATGVCAGMRSKSITNITLLPEDFFSALKNIDTPVSFYANLKSFCTTIAPYVIPTMSLGFSVYCFYKQSQFQQEQFEFTKSMAAQQLALSQDGMRLGVLSFILGLKGYGLAKQNMQIATESYELAKQNMQMSAETIVSQAALAKIGKWRVTTKMLSPIVLKIAQEHANKLKENLD